MRTPDSLISSAYRRHLIYCEATVAHITAPQDLGLSPKLTRSPLVGLDTAPNFSLRYWSARFRVSLGTRRAEANQVVTVLQPCALQADAIIDDDLDFRAISEAQWLAGCARRHKSPGVNIDVVLGGLAWLWTR
jgi:hypothetical protein